MYIVDTGDEGISGSPADGLVYVKVSGSATLTASFITDISGFSFNFIYNAFVDASGDTLLPYTIFKNSSDWSKFRFDANGKYDKQLVGMIAPFGKNTAPAGWLVCNGASVSRTTYADLFAVIGTTFGGSGGNFNLPNLQGEFIRGWDNGRGVDSGRTLGSFQDHQMQQHRHSYQNLVASGGSLAYIGHVALSAKDKNTQHTGGTSNNSKSTKEYCAALLYKILRG